MSARNRVTCPAQIVRQIPLHLGCGHVRHRVKVRVKLGQEAEAIALNDPSIFNSCLVVGEVGRPPDLDERPYLLGFGPVAGDCLFRLFPTSTAFLCGRFRKVSARKRDSGPQSLGGTVLQVSGLSAHGFFALCIVSSFTSQSTHGRRKPCRPG